ncbi:PfkB domain protein [Beutenbergia cavernae DSM 12333]|uniref:Ribokinase n=1 Tax=Beutenbergia cavernae (strain ATCC BAA-8 / DSM 12333 / CCUG 43141 / JCM 11478 / NBRC 16432 / NCIMB 13614 / HKI 0122) TaxID=471853 RepID=C5BW86_BEUC1|nr:ribokinase [Beutenbergia cavernae]ACQ78544.1 PfkB domain protein [Beutenbergia cavernae DSM 12333]
MSAQNDESQGAGSASAPITVVGSANQDYLLRVEASPSPGETVLAHGMRKNPGGKGANQAVAAARLGGDVRFVGCVGDDDDGALLLRELRAEGVGTSDVEIITREHTGLAIVAVDTTGENSIVVVPGANFALTESRVTRVVRRDAAGGVVVLQAEVQPRIIAGAVAAADDAGARVVLNLAPFVALAADVVAACDPLVVNESEASAMTGLPVSTLDDAHAAAGELLGRARSVVITLGARGAVWADGDGTGHVPAPALDRVVDTTGAGDAFVGALAVRLSEGAALEDAVELGVRAGTYSVAREGAQSSYAMAADLRHAEARTA